MTHKEAEVVHQMLRVPKQLRRADMSADDRRKRRLALRRAGGQVPRVEGRQRCPLHDHCAIVFYSNAVTRHEPTTALAAKAKGGAA
jgi:hypothetical protein